MSPELKAAAEAATREYSPPEVKGEVMGDTCFKAGVEWLYAHLTTSAGAFDEAAADAELWRMWQAGEFLASEDWGDRCRAIARWQHDQSSLREAALRAEIESKRTLWKTQFDESFRHDAEITALRAEVAAERYASDQIAKERNEHDAEIARLNKAAIEQREFAKLAVEKLSDEVQRLRAELAEAKETIKWATYLVEQKERK